MSKPQLVGALTSFAIAGVLETVFSQESIDAYPNLAPSDYYADFESIGSNFRGFMQVLDDAERQHIEPFKIFDNLYYVGTRSVSTYLLRTDEGLVLIDSLYGDYVEDVVNGIRELGFDPSDVKYVLGTHGHFDHIGGAAYFQQEFGARIGMTAWDWKRAEADAAFEEYPIQLPERDLVIDDGDVLELGGQVMRFYVTPGHTEGVLSMEFMVLDGENAHRAFVFGGTGLNFRGAWRTQTFINSVRRIRAIADASPSIEVNLTNHPGGGRIIERREQATRTGKPEPFIDPDAFKAYLDALEAQAQAKLLTELTAGRE